MRRSTNPGKGFVAPSSGTACMSCTAVRPLASDADATYPGGGTRGIHASMVAPSALSVPLRLKI